MNRFLVFFLVVCSLAQPPAPPAKIRIRLADNSVVSTRTLEFASGPYTVVSPSCSGGVCTVSVANTNSPDPGTVDYSGANKTILAKRGGSLPSSCMTGEWFFLTSAAPGNNLHICVPDNTWQMISTAETAIPWTALSGSPLDNANLADLLAQKANQSHIHAASDITSGVLPAARLGSGTASGQTFLRGDGQWAQVAWNLVTGVPSQFPPEPHVHELNQVANLNAVLNSKADAVHAHAASDIASGVLAPERLASGTPSTSSFLKGDGTWSFVDWTLIQNRPAEFPPQVHSHSLSELSQSGAAPGQVPQWNGSAWAPASISAGGSVTSVFGRTGAVTAQPGDYAAAQITLTPSGSVSSTSVQAAIEELDAEKAAAGHTHAAADLTSGVLDPARLGSGPASAGSFLRGDQTWTQIAWADIAGKPSVFAPEAHTHAAADLQQSGAAAGQVLKWTGTVWAPAPDDTGGSPSWGAITGILSNQTDLQAALNAKANLVHTHDAGDLASGTVSTARLGSGIASVSTFLRGDQSWASVLWTDIANKPGVFPPDAHAHALADLQQSGAETGQVPRWTGSSWAPASVPASVFGRTGAVTAQAGDYTASQIVNTPAGGIAAVTVQEAINELDAEKAPVSHTHALSSLEQSGASAGQVAIWTGTQWAPGSVQTDPPPVASVFGRTGAVTAASGDYSANQVLFAPVGGITETNVQAALAQLDSQKAAASHTHDWSDLSGLIPSSKLASGTPQPGQFLASNQIWTAVSWTQLQDVPSAFPPAEHTHPVSQLQQSGASAGQVLVWSGSSWTPAAFPSAPVTSVFGRTGVVVASDNDYQASQIGFSPAGNLSAVNVQAALEELDSEKSPVAHTHAADAVVSGLLNPARLGTGTAGNAVYLRGDQTWAPVSWSSLDGIPSAFPPEAHTHPSSAVIHNAVTLDVYLQGLQAAVDAKAPLAHMHSASDLTASGASAGQILKWNGSAWMPSQDQIGPVPSWGSITGTLSAQTDLQAALDTKANLSHFHDAADLVSGRIDAARMGSGTASPGTFLRGDLSWTAIDWSNIANKPSTFPASAHNHPISDLMQSGAAPGQVIKWNGSQWVPESVSYTDLENVPNFFPPAPHNHLLTDLNPGGALTNQYLRFDGTYWVPSTISIEHVQSLANTLQLKANLSHTHDVADITNSGAMVEQVLRWNGDEWVPTWTWIGDQIIHVLPYNTVKVGIGTNDPIEKFDVVSDGPAVTGLFRTGSDANARASVITQVQNASNPITAGPAFVGRNLWGTPTNIAYLSGNAPIVALEGQAYTANSVLSVVGGLSFTAQQTWVSGNTPTQMSIRLVPRNSSSVTSRIRFEGDGAMVLSTASTPAAPAVSSEAKIYVKSNRLIIQYNDAGTVRYKSLLLTGTGTTWAHTTTEP